MYRAFGKRALDLLAAVTLLLLLAPVMLVTALLVRVWLGSPVIFRQPRPGRGGHTFPMIKFRSMTNRRDAAGELLPDAQRLTRFGRFLRSTSLDELPELWNVLKGEMSLVGPRPLRTRYLQIYTPEEQRRHDVPPGITGWAQVNGRNALSWDERLRLDVWYVDHQSLGLDLRILWLTVVKVFAREDVSRPGHVTSPGLDEERLGVKLPDL